MPTDVLLVGAGGHAKVVIEALQCSQGYSLVVCDHDHNRVGKRLLGIHDIQPLSHWDCLPERFHICIGSNEVRRLLSLEALKYGKLPQIVIHPFASISPSSVLGNGVFIAANATIAAESVVGDYCIVNHGAVIDHDSRIGCYSHVAPGATVCGGVTLGEGCVVGAGATILPGVHVGDSVVIGAGSVVSSDIEGHQVVCGVPAKWLKNK